MTLFTMPLIIVLILYCRLNACYNHIPMNYYFCQAIQRILSVISLYPPSTHNVILEIEMSNFIFDVKVLDMILFNVMQSWEYLIILDQTSRYYFYQLVVSSLNPIINFQKNYDFHCDYFEGCFFT